MHIHGLGILHGGITLVGKTKKLMCPTLMLVTPRTISRPFGVARRVLQTSVSWTRSGVSHTMITS
jgi:hypothetical protein